MKTGLQSAPPLFIHALHRLLLKFHQETDCGKPFHWAECEAAIGELEFWDPHKASFFKEWLRMDGRPLP
jgi:hypothetical protein